MAEPNADFLKALTISLRKEFQNGLALVKPTWPEVAMRIPSTTGSNVYSWLGSMPNMKEWIGERVINLLKQDGLRIENKLFEGTVGVPRTAIEDDQVGNYRIVSQQLGYNAGLLPDQMVWPLLSEGINKKCYDGQCFFDEEHPVYAKSDGSGDVTHQSNLTMGTANSAPTWYVIDDVNLVKPIIWQERVAPVLEAKNSSAESDHVFMLDQYLYGARARGNAGYGFWQLAHAAVKTPLTAENLDAVLLKMRKLKADGGNQLLIRPTKLIVPPELETKAKELLEMQIINGSTNIRAGTLKVHTELSLG
ncbi:Mu-like prophage major head subunit gpT family protein [Snodgrassella communis]|uniref:Mu-like prophage major head subunit gpT family protein n=1 Tax=Snodgrassella communis TaxID=2946699 RepID=UPI000C1F7AFE|nr:Mu-like prophage major head subunit gpT family protein [Snodgrassella communis]PIT10268.1 head protein [Snodgrassella communis]PIT25489.1 head protein [Snodgrassella communis]PIT27088.1 head protein [Snodgrassella communis]